MTPRDDSIEIRYGWVIVFASLAIHGIGLGSANILFVALKPIAADLGFLRAVPSMAYSLLMIGVGVGGIGMGWWMDRRGVMQPILFGAVMIALGAIVTSRSESAWSLYVANGLLIGLFGKAAIIVPLIANATRWFDRRRGLAIAILASGQGVAGAAWPPIARFFSDAVGWRDMYLYYAIFVLVTVLPLGLLLRPKPPIAPAGSGPGIDAGNGSVLGMPTNLAQGILGLAAIGCCTAMAIPIVHLFSYATDLGHPAARAAELLSVLFAAAFVSRIGFGMLADRIGPLPTLLISSGCQVAVLFAFSMIDGLVGLYVAALLFGLGFSGIMPCYPLIIRVLFPVTQVGWRFACHYLFAAVGMALGGWLGGVVFDLAGTYTYAFIVAVGFNVMNIVLIGFLHLRHSQMRPSPLPA